MSESDLDRRIDSNARAIESLHELIREGFTNTLHTINEQNQLISENREQSRENAVMIAQLSQAQSETNSQIQTLIEDAKADRKEAQAQRTEAAKARAGLAEAVQIMLAEIARIWQRLSA